MGHYYTGNVKRGDTVRWFDVKYKTELQGNVIDFLGKYLLVFVTYAPESVDRLINKRVPRRLRRSEVLGLITSPEDIIPTIEEIVQQAIEEEEVELKPKRGRPKRK